MEIKTLKGTSSSNYSQNGVVATFCLKFGLSANAAKPIKAHLDLFSLIVQGLKSLILISLIFASNVKMRTVF